MVKHFFCIYIATIFAMPLYCQDSPGETLIEVEVDPREDPGRYFYHQYGAVAQDGRLTHVMRAVPAGLDERAKWVSDNFQDMLHGNPSTAKISVAGDYLVESTQNESDNLVKLLFIGSMAVVNNVEIWSADNGFSEPVDLRKEAAWIYVESADVKCNIHFNVDGVDRRLISFQTRGAPGWYWLSVYRPSGELAGQAVIYNALLEKYLESVMVSHGARFYPQNDRMQDSAENNHSHSGRELDSSCRCLKGDEKPFCSLVVSNGSCRTLSVGSVCANRMTKVFFGSCYFLTVVVVSLLMIIHLAFLALLYRVLIKSNSGGPKQGARSPPD